MQHWGAKPGQRTEWWWRLVGAVLTGLLVLVPGSLVAGHVYVGIGFHALDVLRAIVELAYLSIAVMCWRRSTTPAKMLLGMVICDVGTKRLAGFKKVALRQCAYGGVSVLLAWLTFHLEHSRQPLDIWGFYALGGGAGAGVLLPLLDALPVFLRGRQRLIDMLVGTVVVDR